MHKLLGFCLTCVDTLFFKGAAKICSLCTKRISSFFLCVNSMAFDALDTMYIWVHLKISVEIFEVPHCET